MFRSAQQVTDRLDALIKKIYEIQSPYMHGEGPADVLLVGLHTRLSLDFAFLKATSYTEMLVLVNLPYKCFCIQAIVSSTL